MAGVYAIRRKKKGEIMPIYKDEKTGTWRVVYRKTDWSGRSRQTQKRGFRTRREAQAWERETLRTQSPTLDMTFASFVKQYTADMQSRLKENTWAHKEPIIRQKLLPYFGPLPMNRITPQQIITWQNTMSNYRDEHGRGYSPTYLKTIDKQLNAIFNHAERYYSLQNNPCKRVDGMGKKKGREMLFWTKEEYLRFADAIRHKPFYFHAFELLYWCGIREGELLALTPADFDFERGTLSITKSYQRLRGRDVITSPKTEKGNRTIKLPAFLIAETAEYLASRPELGPNDRIFTVSKCGLYRTMVSGSQAAGVKKIRIHDLRHSHVSLLIEMGFSAPAIADRVGHESIRITYHYAHLFPSVQNEIATKLNLERL